MSTLRRFVASLAFLAALVATSAASSAHASAPSEFLTEIITPAGWEVHSSMDHCSWRDAGDSSELVIPADWERVRPGEEPTWGGCVCSDLVVPAEWRRAMAR